MRGQITFGTISENRPAILMEGDFTQISLSFDWARVCSSLDCHRGPSHVRMGTALFGSHSSRRYELLPSSSRISLNRNRLLLVSWARVSCNPLNGWYSSRHNLAVLGSRLSVCTIPNTQTDWHQGRIPLRSIVEEGLSLIDAAVLEDDAERGRVAAA